MTDSIGVYRIVAPSGSCYVGMTCDSFSNRWRGHLKELRNGNHPCKGLLNSFKKYGEEHLVFEVLETFEISDYPSKNDLTIAVLEAEKFWWMKLHSSGTHLYNGCPTGNGSVYHTEESRKKIRETLYKRILDRYPESVAIRPRLASKTFELLLICKSEKCCNYFWSISGKRRFCSRKCHQVRPKSNTVKVAYDKLYFLYVEKGLSRESIAKELGVSRSSVGNLLDRMGIPRRENASYLGRTPWNKKLSCGHIYNDDCSCTPH